MPRIIKAGAVALEDWTYCDNIRSVITRLKVIMHLFGALVRDEELTRAERARKRVDKEIRVPLASCEAYLAQGWQLKRESKRKAVLSLTKGRDELLEDEVWMLFRKIGFEEGPTLRLSASGWQVRGM